VTGVAPHREGTVLGVRVRPGARREGVVGVHGDALKIAVTAPAEGGRANEALLALLARLFGVPRRDLRLLSGETSREKRVLVALPPRTVEAVLGPLLNRAGDDAGSSPTPSAEGRRRRGAREGA
jgi:uncharacterized protein